MCQGVRPQSGVRPQDGAWRVFPVGRRGDRSRMRVKDAVGRFGEQLAVDRLIAAGLEIIDRNWRCPAGEIDVVAIDSDVLVFVEVKTRSSLAFGDPAEAVSRTKAARLRRLALHWLADHPDRHGVALRFDVVSVLRRGPHGPVVRHIEGAF